MKTRARALLQEAADWRLIALLFESPSAEWQDQVLKLVSEVSDAALQAAVSAIGEDGTESLYHTTFGPGGPAAPREVSYHTSLLPGQMLGDLTAFYEAFAYTPSLPEAPDHVAVESGFIAYLRMKEAYAVECSEPGQADIVATASKRFVDEHLNALAEPLAKSLAASGIPYLAQTAAALLHRVGPRQVVMDSLEACAACDPESAPGCGTGDAE